MEMIREKLSNLFAAMQPALVLCKTVGTYGTLLLIALGFTLWFDFRPFGMICAVCLGLVWCRHCATLQLQKSVRFDETISKLEQKLATLRSSRPISLKLGLASAVSTIVALFHFLPWWMIFATALALVFFVKWKYDIKIIVNHASVSTQETQLDLDVEEFLPEVNEINQCLLKEVDEQCDDTISGTEGIARANEVKNAAEQDEEIYLNMLIPEVDSNDFESAEHSASSSDEMFCPETAGRSSSLQRATKPKSAESGNSAREKQIEFKVSHFNANSSSDSDDNISRGLCFSKDDDYMTAGSRRNKQDNLTRLANWDRHESGPQFDMMSVSSLASNVLVDTMYKRLLETDATDRQPQQQQECMVHSTGFESQNPLIASITNTIRSMRLPAPATPKDNDSTDEDMNSDFEILNAEELNNL